MNPKQFFKEVVKLRHLQNVYFKTKSSMALQAAKKQEKVIDDEISRAIEIVGDNQGILNL